MSINPFSNDYPENMSNDLIKELFVDEFVNLSNVLNRNHHFIWGARGSGKSMLFRYIEACFYSDSIKELGQQSLIETPMIPIYYKIANNALRVAEFKFIDKNYAALLSEHVLIMSLVRLTLNNIKKYRDIEKIDKVQYVKKIVYGLFSIEVEGSVSCANMVTNIDDEPLEWLDLICQKEVQAVYNYLKNIYKKIDYGYQGSISGYHDFLIPFFKLTKELIGINNLVFYLLIDEAGRTYEFQQEILNGWIACRNHDLLSLKLTSVKIEYVTFYTRDKWLIQNTHDYSETDLSIVRYSINDYKSKVRKVIEKRFDVYNMGIDDVESFFPFDDEYQKLINRVREKLKEEYKNCSTKETFGEFCSRRLMPKVYQYLSKKHLNPRYMGFDILVATSSGIIRNFLEPARMMYDDVYQNKGNEICEIPVNIQEENIYKYSKNFFEKIRCISSDPQDNIVLKKLENLIRALGNYFRERLLTENLTEGRIFSFTIRQIEQLDYSERRVLQLAEQNDYLQKSFYSGKNRKSVEEWYLLSRRLAPFFKLDPTALKGRVAFSSYDIQVAMNDPDKFVKEKMDKLRKNQLDKNNVQLELFDVYDELVYGEEEDGD